MSESEPTLESKPSLWSQVTQRAAALGAWVGGFKKRHPGVVRGAFLSITFGFGFVAGLLYGGWMLVCRDKRCPSVEVLDVYTPNQTSKLYAADGRFVAEMGLERRTLVKIADIPRVVREAFVTTEDKRFYQHAGIDWRRVMGAVVRDIRALGWAEGFSTITMQLARNVFPEEISREKTLVRKLKEAKVARAIEQKYSKDKILELYLNQIPLGNGAYGVETAAQRYFGKSVRDLNLAEAATLAGLPKAPERYNPRRFPDRAIQRRNTVIELMRRSGNVGDAEASLAKAYPLQLASREEAGETAPYFVEWIRKQLDSRFGKKLYEQGLKVYTTLDIDMQSAAERALERQLKSIEGGSYGPFKHLTYERFMARGGTTEGTTGNSNTPYLQGAFIALDPRTGAVRAMVGGRDFDDSQFNRMTQALRQPGSTFKPIVYTTAIQSGRAPSYIVDDSPLSVQQSTRESWTPQNYDGKFEGPLPMRRALYESRNLATIRLGMELGESNVIATAKKFGITSDIPPYPSIHIGSADVFPIEMIAAYTAFANLGVRSAANGIIRVENQRGEVLWEPAPSKAYVMTPEEAWLMVDMMKDVVRRGTASGSVWGAGFHVPSGGKTGTTNDGTNVWYIGYTSDLVAGVWMGFDLPQKIEPNAQGGRLAAPAYTAFMTEVYRRRPAPPDWPRPDGIVVRQIDARTGQLATGGCGGDDVATEYFIAGTEPTQECAGGDPYRGTLSPRDTSLRARTDTGGRISPADSGNPFRIPPRIRRDTTRRDTTRRDTSRIRRDTTRRDTSRTTRRDTTRRDTTRRDTTRRDTTRRDTSAFPRIPPP